MKVWDLHCDTLSELRRAEKNGTPASFAHNDLHIDLQKLKKGDYMLQCFAAFVNLGDKTPGAECAVQSSCRHHAQAPSGAERRGYDNESCGNRPVQVCRA